MLFCCSACSEGPCELRMPGALAFLLPDRCPTYHVADPRWREVPSGRSAATAPGLDLVPGPFCEVPAVAIARATAGGGRYAIEIRCADPLEIPVSRRAFHEAVSAIEAVNRAAGV